MIFTFYSYDHRVGRSPALANLAELFRLNGSKVLMIDFDLDTPSLERFFFSEENKNKIKTSPGIIDLFLEYNLIL